MPLLSIVDELGSDGPSTPETLVSVGALYSVL